MGSDQGTSHWFVGVRIHAAVNGFGNWVYQLIGNGFDGFRHCQASYHQNQQHDEEG
jgi:hypothetical protein